MYLSMKSYLLSALAILSIHMWSCKAPQTEVTQVMFNDSNAHIKHDIMGQLDASEVTFKYVAVNAFNTSSQVFTTEIFNSPKAAMAKDSLVIWSYAYSTQLSHVLKDTASINAYHFVYTNPEWDTSITIMKDSLQ